jgi:membrane-associated protease RseP (regulator of RpoE activity)
MTDLDHPPTTGPAAAGDDAVAPEPASGQTPLAAALGAGFLVALLALAALTGGWPLLVTIGALALMITLHELGHYITAKRAGMKVTEFFIGFGPRIWSFRRGETEYGIKAIWIGAYVKIIGMHNLDEFAAEDEPRAYMHKPFWRRLSVAVAGSTMHFILAFVVFVVAFAGAGLPAGLAGLDESDGERLEAVRDQAAWTVDEVVTGSGADGVVRPGDRIISVGGTPTPNYPAFTEEVTSHDPGDRVEVVLERGGERQVGTVTLQPRPDDASQGFFGVGPDFDIANQRVGLGTAVGRSGGAFVAAVGSTFDGLRTIFSPSGLASIGRQAFGGDDNAATVSGGSGSGASQGGGDDEVRPNGLIGISDLGADLLSGGQWGTWLVFFAVINIFIGVFNLVPLLPLDGGHVAIAVYEKVRTMLRKGVPYHVDVLKLLPVTYAFVMILGFLFVSTTLLDTRAIAGE